MESKRDRFVAEYLVDLNATQAAIRAGYSKKTAYSAGQRLLKDVEIQQAIEAAQNTRANRTGITQDRVLEELALLAFSNVQNYIVDDNGDVTLADGVPDVAWRALQSIKRKITRRGTGERREITREVELRLWDKPGPLKLAGIHVGLFTEKHEHSGPAGGPIPIIFGGRHKKPD